MNKEQQELMCEVYENYKLDTVFKKTRSIGLSTTPSGLSSKEGFINKCKTDTEFSKKWGLKIEERELSFEERHNLDHHFDCLIGEYPEHHITLDKRGVPRKLITITYKDKTIESYE